MSLLNDLANKALGSLLGKQKQGGDTTAALLPAMSGLLQKLGGIEGLTEKFQQAGLGDKISAWVTTGPNPPTDAAEVKAVLGTHLDEIAQQTGQDPDTAASGLSALLPNLIDKLTPDGQAPSGDGLQQGLDSLLKSGLGKLLG